MAPNPIILRYHFGNFVHFGVNEVCVCAMCAVYREFNRLLDAYVNAVSRGSIHPAEGRSIRDNLLNNDQTYVTLFVPTNAATVRSTAYEKERYTALRQGFDPHLLQKVTTCLAFVQTALMHRYSVN